MSLKQQKLKKYIDEQEKFNDKIKWRKDTSDCPRHTVDFEESLSEHFSNANTSLLLLLSCETGLFLAFIWYCHMVAPSKLNSKSSREGEGRLEVARRVKSRNTSLTKSSSAKNDLVMVLHYHKHGNLLCWKAPTSSSFIWLLIFFNRILKTQKNNNHVLLRCISWSISCSISPQIMCYCAEYHALVRRKSCSIYCTSAPHSVC